MKIIKQFYLEGIDFLKQLYLNRLLIFELTKRDFKTKYIQNLFGLSWAVLEPLSMLLILWIVFTKVFPSGNTSGFPFYLYMLTGLIAYDFFNKALNQATRSIKDFSFLVKQVNFRIAVLPMIYIFSELIILGIILCVLMFFCLLSGVYPSVYWFQVFYYIFSACCLLISISWFTSSILCFFPDIYFIISITMRVLFFFTPIFWQVKTVSPQYIGILKLNPLFYLVEGFRMSFLTHQPFWSDTRGTLYYWLVTIFFFFIGIMVFKRLRPHFADVV
jgi:ABC-type polysaccharide/polyol phosphate export permease